MKLWIDTDCGVDDSTAILICLNAPNVEIVGISCIGGNVSCEQVTKNVRRTLKAYGHGKENIPVYSGCSRGLIADPMHVPQIHGNDGLGDIDHKSFDVDVIPPIQEEDAIHAIIKAFKGNDDLYLLTLGPLTNIAIALQICPQIASKFNHLYVMGGAYDCRGNSSPFAEFNFYCDPEAAAIVFRDVEPSRITMSTWTLTLTHSIEGTNLQKIFHQKETKMQRWIGATWHLPIAYDENRALMADPLAAFICVTKGSCIKEENRSRVIIPLSSELRGATVCSDDKEGVHIVTKVDMEAYMHCMDQLLNHH